MAALKCVITFIRIHIYFVKFISVKPPNLNILNLFLAEDDSEDIEIITEILLSIVPGSRISVAKNGEQFMDLLRSATELPSLVFLDLNMPIKNGFECLREIKCSNKWNGIKTVILSTSNQAAQMKTVYDMGADLYLVKPASYSAFTHSLTRCLTMDWDSLKNI